MIYAYDRAYMLFATVFALLATVICSKIVMVQLQVLAEADNASASDEEAGEKDMSAVVRGSTSSPLSIGFLQEYISLRLPFELFWGYSVCLVFLYLNTWLLAFGLNPKVSGCVTVDSSTMFSCTCSPIVMVVIRHLSLANLNQSFQRLGNCNHCQRKHPFSPYHCCLHPLGPQTRQRPTPLRTRNKHGMVPRWRCHRTPSTNSAHL